MSVRLLPLGGLGEIGMNCLALEQEGEGRCERLLIDCGVRFPVSEAAALGVELYHPRFEALLAQPLAGLVLTHGHEDHVGAVPFMMRALEQAGAPLPVVWGPPYALALCRLRLEEAGFARDRIDLRAIAPRARFAVGSFAIEPVAVAHSMPESLALAIDTRAGLVVHSGDFKMGEATDTNRFGALGDRGVRLLMSDSTNVFASGESGSEDDVAVALERVIAAAPGRVVVALFASNVHRLRALGEIAARVGRRLCLLGRSVTTHAGVGRELGLLAWRSDLVVAAELAAGMQPQRVLVVASGSQAEPRSALRRLASEIHPAVKLAAGDTVIMSSRIIPGNERAVYAMLDDLAALGVVLHAPFLGASSRDLHASGHAHRGEQRRLIELLRPRAFLPLHGTLLHLLEHAALARAAGVGEVLVRRDGESAELDGDGLRPGSPFAAGAVPWARVPLAAEVLDARRRLARAGVVWVALARGPADLRVVARAQGVPDPTAVAALAEATARAACAAAPLGEDVVERVRLAVRRRIAPLCGERPAVEVSVVVVGGDRV